MNAIECLWAVWLLEALGPCLVVAWLIVSEIRERQRRNPRGQLAKPPGLSLIHRRRGTSCESPEAKGQPAEAYLLPWKGEDKRGG